jgi:hypothetical protein
VAWEDEEYSMEFISRTILILKLLLKPHNIDRDNRVLVEKKSDPIRSFLKRRKELSDYKLMIIDNVGFINQDL